MKVYIDEDGAQRVVRPGAYGAAAITVIADSLLVYGRHYSIADAKELAGYLELWLAAGEIVCEPYMCPFCGEPLEPDHKYMQGRYGYTWHEIAKVNWIWVCPKCEESGLMHDLILVAKKRESGIFWE